MRNVEISEYEKQALDFLVTCGVDFSVDFVGFQKHFEDDVCKRDVFTCTFSRGGKHFSIKFGQSVANSRTFIFEKSFSGNTLMYCDGSFIPSKNSRFAGNRLLKGSNVENYPLHKKGTSPTANDVLTCLTKYDHRRFTDFFS